MKSSSQDLFGMFAAITVAVLYSVFIPLQAISAPATPATPAAPSKVSVWTVVQQNPWGLLTSRVNAKALRIDGATGGSIVAKAPNWKIMVFHKVDGRGRLVTFEEWQMNNKVAHPAASMGVFPVSIKLCGLPALSYRMKAVGLASPSSGSDMLFQGHVANKERVSNFVNVAQSNRGLSPKVLEAWRLLVEVPLSGVIPLENGVNFKDGTSTYTLRLLSQKNEMIPASTFDYPKNIKLTKDPMLPIFFGKQAEDMAEIFWSK